MKMLLGILLLMNMAFAKDYTAQDLMGVWKVTKFVTVDNGLEENWCGGVKGTLAYLPGKQMNVAINCKDVPPGSASESLNGILFYSGPFEVHNNNVIHNVKNFSHPSLNKKFERKIGMRDADHLKLSGKMADGKEVVLTFKRQEKFTNSNKPITGFWKLIGSENEVAGSTEKIPFCNGFYGSIIYTPGGYNAVSINCGKKKDPGVDEPADMFGRKYFYAGTYKLSGRVALHTPETASEAKDVGKLITRDMEIKGNKLFLVGVNGLKFTAIWQKVSSF